MKGNPPNEERIEQFETAVKTLRDLAKEKLKKKQMNPSEVKGTLIDYLIEESNQDLAQDEFISFLIAGIDTSASLQFFALNEIGRRSDIQDKM